MNERNNDPSTDMVMMLLLENYNHFEFTVCDFEGLKEPYANIKMTRLSRNKKVSKRTEQFIPGKDGYDYALKLCEILQDCGASVRLRQL